MIECYNKYSILQQSLCCTGIYSSRRRVQLRKSSRLPGQTATARLTGGVFMAFWLMPRAPRATRRYAAISPTTLMVKCGVCSVPPALQRVLSKVGMTSEALRSETNINLRSNQMSADELTHIAGELIENRNLGELDLAANGFGERGAEAVADIMRRCAALSSLTLDNNNLRTGAMIISDALAENQGLLSLRMAANVVGPGASLKVADAIAVNTTLKALDLSSNAFGAVGGQALAKALARSAGTSNLRRLNLTACAVGVQSAVDLAASLSGTGGHGLAALDMTTCFIGPEGLAGFAAMLRDNTTLLELSLRDNNIGQLGDRESGTCGTALANALEANTTLRVLDLAYNGLSKPAMNALISANARRATPVDLILEGN